MTPQRELAEQFVLELNAFLAHWRKEEVVFIPGSYDGEERVDIGATEFVLNHDCKHLYSIDEERSPNPTTVTPLKAVNIADSIMQLKPADTPFLRMILDDLGEGLPNTEDVKIDWKPQFIDARMQLLPAGTPFTFIDFFVPRRDLSGPKIK